MSNNFKITKKRSMLEAMKFSFVDFFSSNSFYVIASIFLNVFVYATMLKFVFEDSLNITNENIVFKIAMFTLLFIVVELYVWGHREVSFYGWLLTSVKMVAFEGLTFVSAIIGYFVSKLFNIQFFKINSYYFMVGSLTLLSLLILAIILHYIVMNIVIACRRTRANIKMLQYLPVSEEDWKEFGVTIKNITDVYKYLMGVIDDLDCRMVLVRRFSLVKETQVPKNKTSHYSKHIGNFLIESVNNACKIFDVVPPASDNIFENLASLYLGKEAKKVTGVSKESFLAYINTYNIDLEKYNIVIHEKYCKWSCEDNDVRAIYYNPDCLKWTFYRVVDKKEGKVEFIKKGNESEVFGYVFDILRTQIIAEKSEKSTCK